MAARSCRNLGNDFGEAGDGEAAVIHDQAAPGADEFGAGQPCHLDVRSQRTELARDGTRVEIAGCLTAGQQQAHAQDVGRWNRVGSREPPSLISTTVRSSAGSPPTVTVAA